VASPALIRDQFRALYGREATAVASAPGRVNLIGEHTDYNDGFVLPMAIDRRTWVAVAPRSDERVFASSSQFPDRQEVLFRHGAHAGTRPWNEYIAGVVWAMQSSVGAVRGFDAHVVSDVPVGAGLSSSAALELAVACALSAMHGARWDARAMAMLGQRAENEYVGVRCGIMDQMAAAASRAGSVMLLDCRSLHATYAPLPPGLGVVVMDTGVRRALSASEYNDRRDACERATHTIAETWPAVRALRDVAPDMFAQVHTRMDPLVERRARHVIGEMQRPSAMTHAFAAGDVRAAGALLDDSHASLRDLYEVSSSHLDIVCEEARLHPACYGARLTGAGFGGCAIAFVDATRVDDFIASVQPRYEGRTYKKSSFFAALPSAGAHMEPQ